MPSPIASFPNASSDGGSEGNSRGVVSKLDPSLENKCEYCCNGYGVGVGIGLFRRGGQVGDDIIVSKRHDCKCRIFVRLGMDRDGY